MNHRSHYLIKFIKKIHKKNIQKKMNKALIIGLLLIGITLSCTCDDGLLYERKTNSCIPKIPNCTAMTYTLGVYACEICEEGYLVDKEGNCIVIDAPNCAKASFEKSENKVICQ